MFQIGEYEVHILNGGNVLVDGGGAFGLIPRVMWSQYQTPNSDHMIPMSLNCLLIKGPGKNVLVDVGMGNKLDRRMERLWHITHPHGKLDKGLARLGLTPENIDLVINTHLHGDHCEANTKFDKDGNVVPMFPNAEHVVQRQEYEDAMAPNERTRATYIPLNYEPLAQTGQLRLLEGDEELLPGIHAVLTPGHTPGHMGVQISVGDDHLFFPCDLATYAVHFERLPWMTAYDLEPLVTMEVKRKWQQWAVETNAIVIFPHDTTLMAARLTENEKGRKKLIPLIEDDGACYA